MTSEQGMTEYELEAKFCKGCDLYNKELDLRELDVCWRCYKYRRIGEIERRMMT